jgi:hypothetical protein
LHEKALQTLFRGDNRVSKRYNCSNKPVNALSFSIWVYSYVYFISSTLCMLEWTI